VVEILAALVVALAGSWRTDTLVAPDGSKAALVVPSGATQGKTKGHPLVVWLHGGLGANNPAKGLQAAPGFAALADSGGFALLAPSAWPASPWWSASARDRLLALVDAAGRKPGVDASRIVLSGASDGGTGALWLAVALRGTWRGRLRGVAVWSTNPSVLEGRGAPLDASGLAGLAIRWRAGSLDRLYDPADVARWWARLEGAGAVLDTRLDPLAGHDMIDHQADLATFPTWVRSRVRR
jgi:poly(3-hydroxybutyrate) depolymerase